MKLLRDIEFVRLERTVSALQDALDHVLEAVAPLNSPVCVCVCVCVCAYIDINHLRLRVVGLKSTPSIVSFHSVLP